MGGLPLTPGEFRQALLALDGVRVGETTPRYFRRFVLARLRESCPGLVRKVQALGEAQVDLLRRHLWECQAEPDDADGG
jgi:hypothetical protein